MHTFDPFAESFTLAAQLRPESTAIAAAGLIERDTDNTIRLLHVDPAALDNLGRNLESGAAEQGQWAILSHYGHRAAVLIETNVPATGTRDPDLSDLPVGASGHPNGVIEHDADAGSRYWVFTGFDLDSREWEAQEATQAFFTERCDRLTAAGWDVHNLHRLDREPATAEQWADRWCITAAAEAVLAVNFESLPGTSIDVDHHPDDEVAVELWRWTRAWAEEQLGYLGGTEVRKEAEDYLLRLDPNLMRDYLRHAATAPAHLAMAGAVGARLGTAPHDDTALLDRLDTLAQRIWAAGPSAREGYARWSSWRTRVNARLDHHRREPLHLAVERHSHFGPMRHVIDHPVNLRLAIESFGLTGRNSPRPAAPPSSNRSSRGRGRS